jgi:UDP-N-acetylmuramate--alanine ligase
VTGAHPDADVHYVRDRAGLGPYLAPLLRAGDLCVTLGAGDLYTLPDELRARPADPPEGS